MFALTRLLAGFHAAPRQAWVIVGTVSGNTARFHVEIADSIFRRGRGMMGRASIPANGGMLLAYPRPRVARIWMAGTPVALDAIFADSNGRIVKIAQRLESFSKRTVSSESRVKWVLEIAAGEAVRLGIAVGDMLTMERKGISS